jgi:hypothetical protein
VSNTLKSVYSHFMKFSDESDPEKFTKLEKAMNAMGISMKDANHNLIPVDVTLGKLAEKVKDPKMNDAIKLMGENLASGGFQVSKFMVLLDNWDDVMSKNEAAMLSQGVAAQKNQMWMDSLGGSMNQLKNQWDKFVASILQPKNIKFFVDLGTAFLQLGNDSKVLGIGLTVLSAVLSGVLAKATILPLIVGFTKLGQAITDAIIVAETAAVATGSAEVAVATLGVAAEECGVQLVMMETALGDLVVVDEVAAVATDTLAVSLGAAETAAITFNAVMTATGGPIIWITAALGLLVGGLWAYSKASEEAQRKAMAEGQAFLDNKKSADLLFGSLEDLRGKTKLTSDEHARLQDAAQQLIKIFPSLKGQIDDSALSEEYLRKKTEEATAAQKAQKLAILETRKAAAQGDLDSANRTAFATTHGASGIRFGLVPSDTTKNAKKVAQDQIDEINASIKQINTVGTKIVPIKNSPPPKKERVAGPGTPAKEKKGASETAIKTDILDQFSDYKDQIDKTTDAISFLNAEQKTFFNPDGTAMVKQQVTALEAKNAALEEQKDTYHRYADALIAVRDIEKQLVDVDNEKLKNGKLSIDERNEIVKDLNEHAANVKKVDKEVRNLQVDWYNAQNDIASNLKETNSLLKDTADAQKTAITELQKIVEDYVKQGLTDQINAEKDLLKNAKDELDLKLKQIDAEQTLADFTKNRADLEKSIAEDTDKINELKTAATQGDAKAKAKLLEVTKNQTENQSKLDDLINKNSVDNTKQALNDEYNEYEKASNDRIDLLEKELKDASNITKQANVKLQAYLKDNSNSLYKDLITWNSKYGTGMDNDIISKWTKAIDLVKQYNNTLSGGFTFERATEALTAGSTSNKESIIAQMKANSAAWSSASVADKASLNATNKALASSIGYSYNPADGKYYAPGSSVALYDNGGLKPKGQAGYMAENVKEWVFDDSQLKAVQQMAISEYTKMPAFNNITSNSSPSVAITIQGSVSDDNLTKITNEMKDVITKVSQGTLNNFRQRGLKQAVSLR